MHNCNIVPNEKIQIFSFQSLIWTIINIVQFSIVDQNVPNAVEDFLSLLHIPAHRDHALSDQQSTFFS